MWKSSVLFFAVISISTSAFSATLTGKTYQVAKGLFKDINSAELVLIAPENNANYELIGESNEDLHDGTFKKANDKLTRLSPPLSIPSHVKKQMEAGKLFNKTNVSYEDLGKMDKGHIEVVTAFKYKSLFVTGKINCTETTHYFIGDSSFGLGDVESTECKHNLDVSSTYGALPENEIAELLYLLSTSTAAGIYKVF